MATRSGDASIAATNAINAVETTFASSYAGGVNGRTTGTSPLTTGLLSQLAGAGRVVSTALNSAVTSAIAAIGAANVTLAHDTAQAEADHHEAVAADKHATLVASAGATAPSTQLALARKNWLSGTKTAFVSHAQSQAQSDATLDNQLATAAATASQARSQADETLLQASLGPMQTYWNGAVADQMAYYQGSVERENAWHLGQAAADKSQSVAQANATRDFMAGMYKADGDYQSAYHKADADYYNSRLDANPDAETERSTAQTAAQTQRTQSRGSTLVGYVTGEMGAKVGFTQASTSSTSGYLSEESAAVRNLRGIAAEREYAFSTALIQPTSAQQATYAAADVQYFTSARTASNAHDLSDADAWTSFHAADYSARVSALGSLSSGLSIPWASFQYSSALAESQWWSQQQSDYRDLTIAANQEHDLYQARVNSAYTTMRSAQALADSAFDITSASLSRQRALNEALADDQYVQLLAPAAGAYQVAYAQAHQTYAIQQAQAEAGQGPENPGSPNTGLAHSTYALAEVSATSARRLGLATAEQAYRDASGAADVTWTAVYADSQRNFLEAESDAHRQRQSTLGNLLWNYRAAEAQSYSSALSAYATTYATPWAHRAAEQAQAQATYTNSVATSQRALLANQANAKYDLEVAQANADRQHAVDLANARAASQQSLGLAAISQATAQNTTDSSQLTAGQYRPTLPEWTSNVQLASVRPEFNDTGATYNRPPVDGMTAGVVGKMFYAIAAQTEVPENYWDEWDYHLSYGFSGHYPGNYLREGVLRPLPPQVTLDDAATPEATLGADAAKQVSQTAALTRPAAQKKPRSGWQTTGDLGAGSSAAVSAEVQQFMELAAVCPEAASQLAPSIVFTDPMQNGYVTINQDASGGSFSTSATSDPEAQTRLAGAVMSAGLSEPGWQLDPGLDDSPIRDLVGSYTESSAGQVVEVPASPRPRDPNGEWSVESHSVSEAGMAANPKTGGYRLLQVADRGGERTDRQVTDPVPGSMSLKDFLAKEIEPRKRRLGTVEGGEFLYSFASSAPGIPMGVAKLDTVATQDLGYLLRSIKTKEKTLGVQPQGVTPRILILELHGHTVGSTEQQFGGLPETKLLDGLDDDLTTANNLTVTNAKVIGQVLAPYMAKDGIIVLHGCNTGLSRNNENSVAYLLSAGSGKPVAATLGYSRGSMLNGTATISKRLDGQLSFHEQIKWNMLAKFTIGMDTRTPIDRSASREARIEEMNKREKWLRENKDKNKRELYKKYLKDYQEQTDRRYFDSRDGEVRIYRAQ